ncbi:unnamed protein product [Calypogeia fissa]
MDSETDCETAGSESNHLRVNYIFDSSTTSITSSESAPRDPTNESSHPTSSEDSVTSSFIATDEDSASTSDVEDSPFASTGESSYSTSEEEFSSHTCEDEHSSVSETDGSPRDLSIINTINEMMEDVSQELQEWHHLFDLCSWCEDRRHISYSKSESYLVW